VRVGVNRFQSTGADDGINFRWLFNLEPGAYHTVASFNSILRSHDDRRPSKFIVLADSMKSAIKMAWEHGGADFQSRFDKSTAEAQELKEGALRVL
jgi:hypothetical protein